VEDSRVFDCAVEYNSGEGVLSQYNGHNEIRRCRVIGSATGGIISVGTSGAEVIADCVVENNTSYGIQVSGPDCLIVGNHCVLNTSQGIVIGSDSNRIEGNTVLTANGVVGIGLTQSGYSHNVTVRNYVSGGGSDSVNYSLGTLAGSDYGPVGSAATATSPWANISH
jgi:parallel beta-helix repeat protein